MTDSTQSIIEHANEQGSQPTHHTCHIVLGLDGGVKVYDRRCRKPYRSDIGDTNIFLEQDGKETRRACPE